MHFYPRSPCGERHPSAACRPRAVDFYPRSPCGERHGLRWEVQAVIDISIHALLAESDCQWRRSVKLFRQFLSTLSLRRATRSRPHWAWRGSISIHALLAESDCVGISGAFQSFYFYPRSPCGERPPLADGAEPHAAISIHALLAESDQAARRVFGAANIFLSTLSLRRATGQPGRSGQVCNISIHALLAESDSCRIR